MRREALLLAMTLAACSGGEEGTRAEPDGSAAAAAAPEDRVRCALAGGTTFEANCTREIAQGPDGEIWIVRHPDGAFRRFVLIDEGRRIATADGADEVHARRQGADLEVRVLSDRYLFPAAPEPQSATSHAAAS